MLRTHGEGAGNTHSSCSVCSSGLQLNSTSSMSHISALLESFCEHTSSWAEWSIKDSLFVWLPREGQRGWALEWQSQTKTTDNWRVFFPPSPLISLLCFSICPWICFHNGAEYSWEHLESMCSKKTHTISIYMKVAAKLVGAGKHSKYVFCRYQSCWGGKKHRYLFISINLSYCTTYNVVALC